MVCADGADVVDTEMLSADGAGSVDWGTLDAVGLAVSIIMNEHISHMSERSSTQQSQA